MKHADIAIVGGGIVGLATAYQLSLQNPGRHLVLIEKENHVAAHQTGRNSGVIHSGIYYKPGSAKAANCTAGRLALEQFCLEHDVPFERCGKIIVASSPEEIPALEMLEARARLNGVQARFLEDDEIKQREPHVSAVAALLVPEAGIVDYSQVSRTLAGLFRQRGHEILTGTELLEVKRTGHLQLVTTQETVEATFAVTCAGLFSDRVATLFGDNPCMQIVPFRGEYFELTREARSFCHHLIYPVPDSRFPFLGVHFTRRIDGSVECGPNAVLALAREGYRKSSVSVRDLWQILGFSGFRHLSRKYWRTGIAEYRRSFSKKLFTEALQKLVPAIQQDHLIRAPSGVRAQALLPDGSLADDFIFLESESVLHVLNAPSPAATASLEIGRVVAERIQTRL